MNRNAGAAPTAVTKCLSRHGYRLLEAANGVEALDVWKRHRHEIDLVLTDMVMPEGLKRQNCKPAPH